MDKFILRTKEGLKEVYGVAFEYYLNEDKIIIFTSEETVITCYPEAIEDMEDNVAEDEKFYEMVSEMYYERFKWMFKNIAKTIVQEKTDVNEMLG